MCSRFIRLHSCGCQAEAVTLTVAQAFNIAYERWQDQKKKKEVKRAAQAKEKSSNKDDTDGPLGRFPCPSISRSEPPTLSLTQMASFNCREVY